MSDHDNNEQEMDTGTDLITLIDDDGQEHEFEILDTAEMDDTSYVALIPVYENPDELIDDTGDLIILKQVTADGEDFLENIEDDDEFEKIGKIFTERLSDVFDFEDEE